jgi:secreted PhoX family phosphatase
MHDDHDDDVSLNRSGNPEFAEILETRYSRRAVVGGGMGAAAVAMFGGMGLVGCSSDNDGNGGGDGSQIATELGFDSIPRSFDDVIKLPPGYKAQALIPWGTPITGSYPAFDTISASNSAAEQAQQVGMHHDGMTYFPSPLGSNSSEEGLLCVNHEYGDMTYAHPTGQTIVGGVRTAVDEVRKEINIHGISVVHIARKADGRWDVVRSPYNRRITAATPMEIRGPVRGSALVRTKFSPTGLATRGTLNNCANGYTPWGTYLTCEENWAGYFVNTGTRPREHARHGVATSNGRYRWETAAGHATEINGEFERFNATTVAESATQDYRNEPNTFGWVVEIDPFDPNSVPKKRTALGRMGHEGAWVGPRVEGQPLAYYMGDDARGEYVYKFVSEALWNPADENAGGTLLGDKYLDAGTLYVARFTDDGRGEWLPLDISNPLLTDAFADQAELLVNTRTAADLAGATPMDRPEWGAVNPLNGEVYMAMTNNTDRTAEDADAANPRAPNRYGHIVRWREDGDRTDAMGFDWDIFVFGSRSEGLPADSADANLSGLDAMNDFASPDGLWFDRRGVLWVQTDDTGDYTYGSASLGNEALSNNQMLAVIPARMRDIQNTAEPVITAENQAELRRFFVGPKQCEVTGVDITPDGRTMFVNIQHPGERGNFAEPGSNWPHPNGDAMAVPPAGIRPRSATVVVTREDGGVIGL